MKEIHSLIGGTSYPGQGARFRAIDPSTGKSLEQEFVSAGHDGVERAADLAAAAASAFAAVSPRERAAFLRAIAAQ